MSKEKTKTEKTFACADCGLHYRTKNLAEACEEACKKGACDSEITAQAIERNEKVKEKVAEADAETANDFEGMWKRALADYQNLQKEMSAERVRMRKNALRDVVEALLPIMDNFSASTAHEPVTDDAKVKNWVAGVGHIRKQMEAMLAEFGVTRIEAEGKPFDAKHMEAVGEEASDKAESGTVLRETSAGYAMGDIVIRPAKVITVK